MPILVDDERRGKIISAPCRALTTSREEEGGVAHNERKLGALDSRLLSLRETALSRLCTLMPHRVNRGN